MSNLAYLDHALRGPLPRRARSACAKALEAAALGSLARADQALLVERARSRLAKLLDWPPTGLAFTQNTTHAISTFAQAVAWSAGDRVVVHQDEVPANVLPWRALESRGVSVQVLPSRDGRLVLEDLEATLREGPARVVSLAAVALGTGERRDLSAIGQLAAEHGAWFCVDGAQAVGALQLDLQHVTALFGSGRKWLLGPPAVGYLAVQPQLLDTLCPAAGGALSLAVDGGWRADARRFEGGALPAPLLAGLAASLELLLELDPAAVESRVLSRAHVRDLAREAGYRVLSAEGTAASGVVHLELPGARLPSGAAELEAALADRGVVVRVTPHSVRVSPHAWSTQGDVARLLKALAELRPARPPGPTSPGDAG